jgi:6-pyruvoyltetrahydropterin/6-carboxytetrahydropterin synthase
VQVVLAGEKLDDAGMLVDFIDVKNLMGSVMARLDHQNLNEVAPFDVKNPSAENIAEYFYSQMTGGLVNTPVPVRILEVKVWETEIQSATYRP